MEMGPVRSMDWRDGAPRKFHVKEYETPKACPAIC
jgi:hypothetical protein